MLKKYVEATEAADFRAFESIIRAEATFRMPPQRDTAAGREAMFRLWIEGGFGSEQFGHLRCVVTHANCSQRSQLTCAGPEIPPGVPWHLTFFESKTA